MKPVLVSGYDGRKPSKMRPPMRSSIACLRCRKSKIKCENTGGSSPCDSCIKSGKECIFKLPEATAAPPKRSEAPSVVKQERDGGSDRKKLKKIEDIKLDNQKALVYSEILSAPFLTEDLWDQLLDLYKQHFAPELSFLHLPTIREQLGRKFRSQHGENSEGDINLVLLGILTLTARFQPDLVKYLAHVSNGQSGNARSRPLQTQLDPGAASEYYADALTVALGPLRTAMKVASVERVQALLMLGLYEWGQTLPKTGGLSAWMYVGAAIRMAHFLNLRFGDKLKDSGDARSRPLEHRQRGSLAHSQAILEREIRRRTMFSCFILDRMLACGKDRISMIQPMDLQIQLPCSEDKFDLAMEANTDFLYPRHNRDRTTNDDSVLGRFVRLVDIWGEISKYSVAGGRLTEALPPWKETTFRRLREELAAFEEDLPSTFTFSRSNYFKHENHASSAFILMHMLRNVSHIMLHREYIPFIALRSQGPEGPLDRPTFPKGEAPDKFWLDSAVQVFKPAREIVDLIEICQKKDKLPQSTIVVFAVWTAAFVGLYAAHYPWMDTEQHMVSHKWNEGVDGDIFQRGPTGLAYQTLSKMSNWLQMASTYTDVLRYMDQYLRKVTEDFERHAEKNKALSEQSNLSVRLGGRGGGLEEYQQMSKKLKDFGTLHPDDQSHDTPNSDRLSRPSTLEGTPSVGGDNHSAYAPEGARTPLPTPSASFTAINHAPITPATPDSSRFTDHRGDGMPRIHGDLHADQWTRQTNVLRPQFSPGHSYLGSTGAILDPAATAAQTVGYSQPQLEIDHEESKRFGDTNDLEILTQNDDTWSQPFAYFLGSSASLQIPPDYIYQ